MGKQNMSEKKLVMIRESLENMEYPIIFMLMERLKYQFDSTTLQAIKSFLDTLKCSKTAVQKEEYPELNNIFFKLEEKLFSFYFSKILPNNSGSKELPITSIFLKDANFFMQVMERIRIGIFVAQAKFDASPELYQKLANENNIQEINKQLTNIDVELKILDRIKEKACQLNFINPSFNPEIAVSFYKDCIIPLTKELELEYLLMCKS